MVVGETQKFFQISFEIEILGLHPGDDVRKMMEVFAKVLLTKLGVILCIKEEDMPHPVDLPHLFVHDKDEIEARVLWLRLELGCMESRSPEEPH
jgi:hypothetical protein